MNKRLLTRVAFLLIWGKALASDPVLVNTWHWCEPAPSKKDKSVLPPVEVEDIPVTVEEVLDSSEHPSVTFSPNYQTITAADISLRKTADLVSVLSSMGMQIVASGGKGSTSSLIYKGYSGFDIKVYVDGILANSTTTGEFDWNSIDVSTVESVTIVEIPSGQSEFAGCIVHIRTKKVAFSSVYIDSSVSSYLSKNQQHWADGTQTRFSVADVVSKHSYSFSNDLSYDKNEYFRNISTPVNWDNFDRLSNTSVKYQFTGNKLNTSLSARYTNNYIKAYSTGPTLSNGIQQDNIGLFQCQFDYALNDSWDLSSVSQFRFDDTEYYVNNSRIRDESEETQSFLVDTSLSLRGPFTSTLYYRHRQLLIGAQASRHEFGGSFEYTHSWSRLGLTLGSNLLVYGDSQLEVEPLPYISLFTDWSSLSAYRAFVLPTFNQLYWGDYGYASGNPTLTPESGWGTTLRFGKPEFPLYLNMTGSYYSNKIRWSYENWRLTPVNTIYVWLYSCQLGCDSFFNFFPWGSEHLKVQTDLTYTRSWLSGDNRQIMWVPQWKAHLGLSLLFQRFQFVLDGTYMGARYISNLNCAKYPAYLIFDSTLSVEPVSGVSLYLKCNNLLDIRVVHHDSYFIPSRKVSLGVQFRR